MNKLFNLPVEVPIHLENPIVHLQMYVKVTFTQLHFSD